MIDEARAGAGPSIRQRMNCATDLALCCAAALTILIAAAHSWTGERRLIGPLLDPGTRQGLLAKSGFARKTLRFAWHLTSLAWLGCAAILWTLAAKPVSGPGGPNLLILAATFGLTGVVTLVISRGRHLAWPVFLAIGGLCLTPLF